LLKVRIATAPNVFTLARVASIGLCWWLVASQHYLLAAAYLVAALLSDSADGYFARVLGEDTHFGAVFDALADAACTAGVIVLLTLYGVMPWWLLVIMAARQLWLALAADIQRQAHRNYKAAAVVTALSAPLLLAGTGPGSIRVVIYISGLTFACAGTSVSCLVATRRATSGPVSAST
jgi:cardiolipin synthase